MQLPASDKSGRSAALGYFFVNGALFGSWATRIPDFKDAFNLSEASLGNILLAMALGAVAAFLLTGRWSDQFGGTRVALPSALIMALSLPVLVLLPTSTALAAGIFIFGASGGSLDLSMNAYGAEVEARRKRSTMSALHGFWSLGFGAAALAGTFALSVGADPLDHFMIVALVCVIVTLWCHNRVIPSTARILQTQKIPAQNLRGTPAFIMLPLLAGVCFLGEGALVDWIAVHTITQLETTARDGSAVLVIFSVVMISMRLTGDRIIIRFGQRRILKFCTFAAMLGFCIIGLAPSFLLLALGAGLTAAGLSMIAPIAFSRAGQNTTPGQAIARVASGGYAGLLLGPVLMGYVGEAFGLSISFIVLAAMMILALFIRI